MKVSQASLKNLLLNNVAEIKFVRRRAKPGAAATRRMLCTSSLSLLNSTEGRLALNYRRAINTPKFNPNIKNLVITWDIFMQDYRCINRPFFKVEIQQKRRASMRLFGEINLNGNGICTSLQGMYMQT